MGNAVWRELRPFRHSMVETIRWGWPAANWLWKVIWLAIIGGSAVSGTLFLFIHPLAGVALLLFALVVVLAIGVYRRDKDASMKAAVLRTRVDQGSIESQQLRARIDQERDAHDRYMEQLRFRDFLMRMAFDLELAETRYGQEQEAGTLDLEAEARYIELRWTDDFADTYLDPERATNFKAVRDSHAQIKTYDELLAAVSDLRHRFISWADDASVFHHLQLPEPERRLQRVEAQRDHFRSEAERTRRDFRRYKLDLQLRQLCREEERLWREQMRRISGTAGIHLPTELEVFQTRRDAVGNWLRQYGQPSLATELAAVDGNPESPNELVTLISQAAGLVGMWRTVAQPPFDLDATIDPDLRRPRPEQMELPPEMGD
jgi:uncharacterized membrane protein